MQTTMEVKDITMTLLELLDSLTPGDEVIFTRNHQRVAKLVMEVPRLGGPGCPSPGLMGHLMATASLECGDNSREG